MKKAKFVNLSNDQLKKVNGGSLKKVASKIFGWKLKDNE